MGHTSGTGLYSIDMASLLFRSPVSHRQILNVSAERGPGRPGMDEARIAILQHERLHWQAEAERLNKIVHAQRDRIRLFEGGPDMILLRKVVTFLQVADIAWVDQQEAKSLEHQLKDMLK